MYRKQNNENVFISCRRASDSISLLTLFVLQIFVLLLFIVIIIIIYCYNNNNYYNFYYFFIFSPGSKETRGENLSLES